MPGSISITNAKGVGLKDCKRLMLKSDPWLTLGYGEREMKNIAAMSRKVRVLVARDGRRVVGFTISTPGFLLGEYLKILAVDSEYRNQGIGKRLMAELEKCVFSKSRNLYLCVSDFNRKGQAFYRRLGYRKIGLLRDLIKKGCGEILMRKTK